jgi:ABC-type dipeptide/oligopeptide/nickel transport system ATPase component
MTEELMLKLRNLKVVFPNAMGVVKAVEGIDRNNPQTWLHND